MLAWTIEGYTESRWSGAPPEAREALDRGLLPDDLPSREAIVSGLLAQGAMVRLDPGRRGRFDRLFGGRDLLLLEVLTGPQAGLRLLVPRGACERVDRR